MPKEIFPSLYRCDCGHLSEFMENTIWEIKAMSQKKKVKLSDDGEPIPHGIIFYKGKMIDIICPKKSGKEK